MRVVVLLSCLGLSLAGPSAATSSGTRQADGALACLTITAEAARLSCYDREVRKMVAPSFEGRLHKTTDLFHVDRPTRLRYQSDGPIFVLYLKAANGEVMQNLHIGGGGEATYLIERSGTYFLDVNGSESWRIWLETEPMQSTN